MDSKLRNLERQAAQGDVEAAKAASRERARAGDPVEAYRRAAVSLYGLTREMAERLVREPGGWVDDPSALVELAMEPVNGSDPDLNAISMYGPSPDPIAECVRLEREAGVGWIEWYNGGVAVVWGEVTMGEVRAMERPRG